MRAALLLVCSSLLVACPAAVIDQPMSGGGAPTGGGAPSGGGGGAPGGGAPGGGGGGGAVQTMRLPGTFWSRRDVISGNSAFDVLATTSEILLVARSDGSVRTLERPFPGWSAFELTEDGRFLLFRDPVGVTGEYSFRVMPIDGGAVLPLSARGIPRSLSRSGHLLIEPNDGGAREVVSLSTGNARPAGIGDEPRVVGEFLFTRSGDELMRESLRDGTRTAVAQVDAGLFLAWEQGSETEWGVAHVVELSPNEQRLIAVEANTGVITEFVGAPPMQFLTVPMPGVVEFENQQLFVRNATGRTAVYALGPQVQLSRLETRATYSVVAWQELEGAQRRTYLATSAATLRPVLLGETADDPMTGSYADLPELHFVRGASRGYASWRSDPTTGQQRVFAIDLAAGTATRAMELENKPFAVLGELAWFERNGRVMRRAFDGTLTQAWPGEECWVAGNGTRVFQCSDGTVGLLEVGGARKVAEGSTDPSEPFGAAGVVGALTWTNATHFTGLSTSRGEVIISDPRTGAAVHRAQTPGWGSRALVSGNTLSYFAPVDGGLALISFDAQTRTERALLSVTNGLPFGFEGLSWKRAADGHVLYAVATPVANQLDFSFALVDLEAQSAQQVLTARNTGWPQVLSTSRWAFALCQFDGLACHLVAGDGTTRLAPMVNGRATPPVLELDAGGTVRLLAEGALFDESLTQLAPFDAPVSGGVYDAAAQQLRVWGARAPEWNLTLSTVRADGSGFSSREVTGAPQCAVGTKVIVKRSLPGTEQLLAVDLSSGAEQMLASASELSVKACEDPLLLIEGAGTLSTVTLAGARRELSAAGEVVLQVRRRGDRLLYSALDGRAWSTIHLNAVKLDGSGRGAIELPMPLRVGAFDFGPGESAIFTGSTWAANAESGAWVVPLP